MHFRFFHVVRSFEHSQLARWTQIDYDREMAFVAVARTEAGDEETLGVARAVADPEGVNAEFAVLVRSDLKRRGLGTLLMNKLIRYCRGRGIVCLQGEVLPSLGFTVDTDGDMVRVSLPLDGGARA